ncbi:hypothetical conserved protein (plasmid) [Rhizobium etli CFN 42]|uniref:Hypothetical conserved protein n=1 Tax=Rhizobium etli (strain ATCC 51251 / DSM 11541 / JCM 21823 / NBRC 15573 / CFN 42) TaxID=347834 RepID=Q2JYV9_RHIEC|nr:hypothetical conserved protein [Rhizobium etli CFN 42]
MRFPLRRQSNLRRASGPGAALPARGSPTPASSCHGHVDLAYCLDGLPDADEARLHDEAVSGFVDHRFSAFRCEFDQAGKDMAELECLALDRTRLTGRRLPYAGMDRVCASNILRPGLEGGVARDQPLGEGTGLARRLGRVGIDRLEQGHGFPFQGADL